MLKKKCNFANNNPRKCEGLFTVNNICDDEESSREKSLSCSSAEMKANPGEERTLRFSALERQHYLSLSQFKILTLCFRDRDTNESSEVSHKNPRWNRGGPLSRSHFSPYPQLGPHPADLGHPSAWTHPQHTQLDPDHRRGRSRLLKTSILQVTVLLKRQRKSRLHENCMKIPLCQIH